MRPQVLVVCTANICRSPAAARLLAGRLGPSVDFVSRGIRSHPGAGMCDVSASWVMMNDGDVSGVQTSQQLQLADVRASMLVLTASQRHQAAVIEMRPSAQVRTFTLVQAARIARYRRAAADASMPAIAEMPDRLLWLAEELDAYRGAAPRLDDVHGDDLPDPHAGAKHADVFTSLLAAVDGFCAPLLGQPLPR